MLQHTNQTDLVHGEHVSKATFQGRWLIIADAGTLSCDATKGRLDYLRTEFDTRRGLALPRYESYRAAVLS